MRILYVCQRVPFPPDRGDKIASYNAIRQLVGSHEVTVATVVESDDEARNALELEKQGIQVITARHSASTGKRNALLALARREPLSVAYFRSEKLAQKIRVAAEAPRFDAVVTFSSSMAQYAKILPETPHIADFVDLDSQKWKLYSQWAQWPKSAVYRSEHRRLLAYEERVAATAAYTLVRTQAECDDCKNLLKEGRFEVLRNGVDLEYFKPTDRDETETNRELVFTGVMDYFPNVQGVTFFCDDVLPLVRQTYPDVRFTIVGSRPSSEVVRLGDRAGVTVTGRVPDVRPYVQRAAIAVVPLLLARGIQNKVLEAMAMGKAVISTSAAFRGVDGSSDPIALVEDDPRRFASEIVRLLRDDDARQALGHSARRFVESHYVWAEQIAKLERLLERCTAGGAAQRDETVSSTTT